MSLHTDLIAAGLPVLGTAIEGQRVFFVGGEENLTAQQKLDYERIVNPTAYIQKSAKANAANQIASATLAGRNITSINNNADRDALMRAVCYQLGIVDGNGIILASPAIGPSKP